MIELPQDIQRLTSRLAEEFGRRGNAELFLVGGLVRDLLRTTLMCRSQAGAWWTDSKGQITIDPMGIQ